VYERIEAEPRRLREYLWVLWKYRWLCLTCFGFVFGSTVAAVIMLLPREYTAAVKIRVASQGSIQLQLTENVLRQEQADRVLHGSSVFTATQVAILKSRDLAERVIRSRRLSSNEASRSGRRAGRVIPSARLEGVPRRDHGVERRAGCPRGPRRINRPVHEIPRRV
jgi:uncharacterized protein involved in exopolysaccharide biosynthesis